MESNDTGNQKYMMDSVKQRKSWLDQFRVQNRYPTFDKLRRDTGYAMKEY